MKFGKRYSKGTVFMAMLHGVLIGVAAVVVIGLLLVVGPKGKTMARRAVKRYQHRVQQQLKIQQSLMKSRYNYLQNNMEHFHPGICNSIYCRRSNSIESGRHKGGR